MKPTIKAVREEYPKAAARERERFGRPGVRTERNAVNGAGMVVREAAKVLGMSEEAAWELEFGAITRRVLERVLGRLMEGGVRPITAWTYVCQFRAMAARWTMGYYEDLGWEVKAPELPHFPAMPARYERPAPELLTKVKAWYQGLKGEERFAATMMLEFGMRNGDVMRLKAGNLVERGGQWYLSYTPHKTRLSSGRRVFWPVCESLRREIGPYCARGVKAEVFARLNRQLRGLGFGGGKASYELRKICIDHVYQRFGAEMAVSLSGDDIRTISRYYADPAQPNLGGRRVVEMMGG